jgi:hypothetical protein
MESSMLLRLDLMEDESEALADALRKLLSTGILSIRERDVVEAILRAISGAPIRRIPMRGVRGETADFARSSPNENAMLEYAEERERLPSDNEDPWRHGNR